MVGIAPYLGHKGTLGVPSISHTLTFSVTSHDIFITLGGGLTVLFNLARYSSETVGVGMMQAWYGSTDTFKMAADQRKMACAISFKMP